jgi:hypothetical protein
MKSIINTLVVAIIPLIALTATIAISNGIAKKVEHCQAAAAAYSQSGSELLSGSYSDMINTLNAISVR